MNTRQKLFIIALASAFVGGCMENDTSALQTVVEGGVQKISSLEISALTDTLAIGEAQTLTAIAKQANGTETALDTVSWRSANPDIVSIDSTGKVTAIDVGSAEIQYEYLGQLSTITVNVTQASLASLSITPQQLSIDACSAATVNALSLYTDGTSETPVDTVSWSISDPEIAGLKSTEQQPNGTTDIIARNAGTAVLSATSDNVSDSIDVVVIDSLAGLSVEDSVIRLTIGDSLSTTVTGAYSDGRTEAISQFISMSTNVVQPQDDALQDTPEQEGNTELETDAGTEDDLLLSTPYADYAIDENDQLTLSAKAAGTEIITIECGGLTTDIEVQVHETPVWLGVEISSEKTELSAGESVQLEALAKYSDGSTETIAAPDWEIVAGDTESFDLDVTTGVVTANTDVIVERTIELQVAEADFVDTVTLYAEKGVAKEVQTLSVYLIDSDGMVNSTAAGTIAMTPTQGLSLISEITYNTGSTEYTNQNVYWSNHNPDVAVVDALGKLVAKAPGITKITALHESGSTATVSVLVTAADSP